MKLRLPSLSMLDPLAVPLPNGTEVTTRVDRIAGARPVPEGAVGRVVRARTGGDAPGANAGFDVLVIGVGEVFYARDELLPRKVGQLAYAHRRADAWNALRPGVVLSAVVGSRAWGLADEGSDTDERGVFVLPFPWTLGLAEAPRDLVSADGSTTHWELGKAPRVKPCPPSPP